MLEKYVLVSQCILCIQYLHHELYLRNTYMAIVRSKYENVYSASSSAVQVMQLLKVPQCGKRSVCLYEKS